MPWAPALDAEQRKRLSFTDLARELGTDRVWTTAALLGQHPCGGRTPPRMRITFDGKFLPYEW
ncbi:hypothetical protein HUO13_24910 [Saccharopolyspora erythraea]|nr:hypothetical protein HUO13_24910 [Saccharopolyspora erythraea]